MSDIFAGQPSDAGPLAEIYDLEHDEIKEDLVFYREMAARARGPVADLGCGSGRLFGPLLAGGATKILGVDGSASLLERAAKRLVAEPTLRRAADEGRIELLRADVRIVERPDRYALAILAGVLSHLDGPEEALRALDHAARLLVAGGRLIMDGLGPGGLPTATCHSRSIGAGTSAAARWFDAANWCGTRLRRGCASSSRRSSTSGSPMVRYRGFRRATGSGIHLLTASSGWWGRRGWRSKRPSARTIWSRSTEKANVASWSRAVQSGRGEDHREEWGCQLNRSGFC